MFFENSYIELTLVIIQRIGCPVRHLNIIPLLFCGVIDKE